MADSSVAIVWRCCELGSAAMAAASLPSAEPSTDDNMLAMPSNGRLLSTSKGGPSSDLASACRGRHAAKAGSCIGSASFAV